MNDARLEREFPVSPERLYAAVTNPADLSRWWGPEGMTLGDHTLDFTRLGPWHSVKIADQGRTMKMSGQVTSINPPNSVGFTWAWHDEEGNRGHESQVRIELETVGEATRFTMTHSGLVDAESRDSHERGWISTLVKLEKLLPLEETAI